MNYIDINLIPWSGVTVQGIAGETVDVHETDEGYWFLQRNNRQAGCRAKQIEYRITTNV